MHRPKVDDFPMTTKGYQEFMSSLNKWQYEEICRLKHKNERLREMVAVYADRCACMDTGETGKLESFTAATATGE